VAATAWMPLGEQACAAPWARDSDSEPNIPQLVLARMRRLGLGLGASELEPEGPGHGGTEVAGGLRVRVAG
jgi:hypothetical protein